MSMHGEWLLAKSLRAVAMPRGIIDAKFACDATRALTSAARWTRKDASVSLPAYTTKRNMRIKTGDISNASTVNDPLNVFLVIGLALVRIVRD
jgi:hypothetical protein